MDELAPDEYSRALPVIEGAQLTYFAIVARSIAERSTPGKFWVDAADRKSSVFMWDEGVNCGLAGETDNEQFNSAVAGILAERIVPRNLSRNEYLMKVYYAPEGWEAQAAALFGGAPATRVHRRLYTLGEPRIADWQGRVPAGYEMRRIDGGMLSSSGLENLDKVVEEIGCCWPSIEHFLTKGFGYCLLGEGRIVCWCTGEYAGGRNIGIGIATDKEYRGRGLATITAAAFVQHCMSNNLRPYWDARTENLPSLAVAEKVGFEKVSDYAVLIVEY